MLKRDIIEMKARKPTKRQLSFRVPIPRKPSNIRELLEKAEKFRRRKRYEHS